MVLITGGAGYIGSHLLLELTKVGYDVVVLDNLSNSSMGRLEHISEVLGMDFDFILGDVSDSEILGDVFKEFNIKTVFHLASPKSISDSFNNPKEYVRDRLKEMETLLSQMNRFKVRSLIFSSSMSVGKSDSPYSESKRLCEYLIEDNCRSVEGFKALCLRYSNPIGSLNPKLSDSGGNILPKTIDSLNRGEVFQVYGADYNTQDGTSTRDYIDIRDLTVANLKSIDNLEDLESFTILDIGSGKNTSVLEILDMISGFLKTPIPFEFVSRREGDFESYVVDVSRPLEVIGWKPTKTVEETLINILKEI